MSALGSWGHGGMRIGSGTRTATKCCSRPPPVDPYGPVARRQGQPTTTFSSLKTGVAAVSGKTWVITGFRRPLKFVQSLSPSKCTPRPALEPI